jgi:hypothetical protein
MALGARGPGWCEPDQDSSALTIHHAMPRSSTWNFSFAVGSKGKAIPVVRSAVIVRTGARFFCSIM